VCVSVCVSGPEKFWAYRWVHAVDGTTDSPFILEIFSTSQPEIFNNICPSKKPTHGFMSHNHCISLMLNDLILSLSLSLSHSDVSGVYSDEGVSDRLFCVSDQ